MLFYLANCIKYVGFLRNFLFRFPLNTCCIWRAWSKCKFNFLTNFVFPLLSVRKVSISHFIERKEEIKDILLWKEQEGKMNNAETGWNVVPLSDYNKIVWSFHFVLSIVYRFDFYRWTYFQNPFIIIAQGPRTLKLVETLPFLYFIDISDI